VARRLEATPHGMVAPYRLSFLVGGLLAAEAAIAAPVYLQCRDWAETRAALEKDNLLHARTQASAVRTARELVQRVACLSDDEVEYLVAAPSPDRKHLMWAAFCRRYDLVAEFAEEALRDRFLLGDLHLVPDDFERFWAGKALWHPELDAVAASTRTKLRTNLFLALRQSGMLTTAGLIVPPLLSDVLVKLLQARTPSDIRFFPAGGTQ